MLELASSLQAHLSAGRTLIVPSAPRAAAVRLSYATRQLAAGQRAFRTPEVHSLAGWLRGQPRLAADGRPLRALGASEEWLLWRNAVTEAAAGLALPPVAGLADALRQSAALLFEWRIDPQALRGAGTPEASLLAESLAIMDRQLCDLSAAAPWSVLQELAPSPPRAQPLLAGFAFHTPARRAWLNAWGLHDATVEQSLRERAPGQARYAAATDPAHELTLIAQWCARHLHAAPGARLLVVAPELATRREPLQRVLDEALGTADATPYALEGAAALRSYAPVAEALRTLKLLTQPLELSEISQWLRGGAWPAATAAPRAALDVWLRCVVPPRLDARQLLQALRVAPPTLLASADEFAAVIAQALALLKSATPATLAQWSGRFAQVLALFDFTARAARQRSSHSQQILSRLDELLQELALLPALFGRFSAHEALSLFTQLLGRVRFEPASGDAAVTVSASFADPILRYDGIWVSGLHAGAFPEHARFDPFIPVALQRKAGIIAADAAALVAQAQQALLNFSGRTADFVVSAPAHAQDLELAPSPLLAPYTAQRYEDAVRTDAAVPRAIRAARRSEHYEDEQGTAWLAGVPLPAGTRAIELQSRCAFRAYAQLRLGARPLEAPQPGITPAERGRLLHRALELLWQELGGSTGLAQQLAQDALWQRIDACVQAAAQEILHGVDPQDTADEAFSQAADATGLLELRRAAIARELQRAARLVHALCNLEHAREPFVIQELERPHRIDIGGALIDVRIDRIDRLADGTHAILDYKSGRAVSPDWELERTTHPQLLVYLQAAGLTVSALAVAHLDPQAVVFKGIGNGDGRLPGLRPAADWPAQLQVWREQVTRLAQDFMGGHARVEPMERACDYCHLHAFCRIAQVQPSIDDDRDAAADAAVAS